MPTGCGSSSTSSRTTRPTSIPGSEPRSRPARGRPSVRATTSVMDAGLTAPSHPPIGGASSAARPGPALPGTTGSPGSGTCTCSTPASRTSTGRTPRSARSSSRSSGSGSIGAPMASGSMSPIHCSRTRVSRTSDRTGSVFRGRASRGPIPTGIATMSTTSTSVGGRSPTTTIRRASSSARSIPRRPRGALATCARMSCTWRSISTSSAPRGTVRRCVPRSTPAWLPTARSGPCRPGSSRTTIRSAT